MSIYRKKIDAIQPELVDHARKLGASVEMLHRVGSGVPDLLLGFEGKNYLVEVKSEKGKLNKLQVKWHTDWKGQKCVIRTKKEIERLLGL